MSEKAKSVSYLHVSFLKIEKIRIFAGAPEPITESSSSDDEEIMPKGRKVKKSTNFIDEF